MNNITQKFKYIISLSIGAMFMIGFMVFAAPFAPSDQELDPNCNPGDLDCYVINNTQYISGLTLDITENEVTLGGEILTPTTLSGNDLIIENDNNPFIFKSGYQSQFEQFASLQLPFIGFEHFDDTRQAFMVNGIVDYTPFSGNVGGSNNFESTMATFDFNNDAIHNILTNTNGNTISSRNSDTGERSAMESNIDYIRLRSISDTNSSVISTSYIDGILISYQDTEDASFRIDTDGIYIKTHAVDAQDVNTGQVLTLQDDQSGQVEYQSLHTLTTHWETVGRPDTPQTGYIGFNTTLNQMEYWNGATWIQF